MAYSRRSRLRAAIRKRRRKVTKFRKRHPSKKVYDEASGRIIESEPIPRGL